MNPDFGAHLQRSQVLFFTILQRNKFSRVGRIFRPTLHLKTLILFSNLSFHSLAHKLLLVGIWELSAQFSFLRTYVATWYRDFTEYVSLFVWSHITLSIIYLQLKGICRISFTSSLWKFIRTTSLSQHLELWSISSETLHSYCSSVGWNKTLFDGWLGIHLSGKIRIDDPSPTLQQLPFCITSWAAIMLFHMYKLFDESTTSRKE